MQRYLNSLPVAPQTLALFIPLAGADAESGVFSIETNRPVEIVGFIPTIQEVGTGDTTPTIEDVLVAYGLNGDRFSSQDSNSTLRAIGSAYMDLLALRSDNRWVDIVLPDPAELQFEVAWKDPNTTFNDIIVGINVLGRYLPRAKAVELARQLEAGEI
jgi:hypothetical protein